MNSFKTFIILAVFLISGCEQILDFESPEIEIISPKMGEHVYAYAEVKVNIQDDYNLRTAEVYFDTVLVGEFNTGNFERKWNFAESGIDKRHTIRIIAKDKRDNWREKEISFFGHGAPPQPPQLKYPKNEDILVNIDNELQWMTVPFVSEYNLQVSEDEPDFETKLVLNKNININQISDTTSMFFYKIRLYDGNYFWKLRCKYKNGDFGKWSSIGNFEVDTKAPLAPIIIYPTSHINDIYFKWAKVEDGIKYHLKVINQTNHPYVLLFEDSSATDTLYSPNIIFSNGYYSWKIRAKDNANRWGEWSREEDFIFDLEPPYTPKLKIPMHESIYKHNYIYFQWYQSYDNASFGDVSLYLQAASNYQFQLSFDENFDQLILQDTIFRKTDISMNLEDGKYYWRVRCQDLAGNWSLWSEIWQVIIDTKPPSIPIPTNPIDSKRLETMTPVFSWATSTDAVSYTLQISDIEDFSEIIINKYNLANNEFQVEEPLQNIHPSRFWYWRVRAKDGSGLYSDWSVVNKFSVPCMLLMSNSYNMFSNTHYNNLAPRLTDGIMTSDGNFMFVGGLEENIISRADKYGNEVWTKSFGTARNDGLLSISQTQDGNFILSGYSQYESDNNPWITTGPGTLFKIDRNGNILWQIKYDNEESGRYFNINCVLDTPDPGYIFSSISSIVKTDAIGNVIWWNYYNNYRVSDYHIRVRNICKVSDGNYVFAGDSASYIKLIKFDNNGELHWEKKYSLGESGYGDYTQTNYINETKDGGIIFTGTIYSGNYSGTDLFIIKTDNLGNESWYSRFKNTTLEYSYFIQEINERYLITGKSDGKVLVLYIDEYGNKIWSRIIGEQKGSGLAIYPTDNDNYIIIAGGYYAQIFKISL